MATKKTQPARMSVNFAFGIGDEVIHKEHGFAGVVHTVAIDRTGVPGYWIEYQNITGDVKEIFVREGQLKAGQIARA